MQMKATVLLVVNGFILTFVVGAAVVLGSYGSDIEPLVAGRVIQVPAPASTFRGYADAQHQTATDFKEHRSRETWDRSYCFEMPGTIADSQRIRVIGHLEHIRVLAFGRTNPFWRSTTPVPPFTIMPTSCYSDDGSLNGRMVECLS